MRTLWLLFTSCLCSPVLSKACKEVYYWRDYDGELPSDAVPHGVGEDKGTVYLGRVLFGGRMVPGQIFANDSKIYFESEGEGLNTHHGISILCSGQPDRFVWVDIASSNHTFIVGGFEPDHLHHTTYFGRIEEKGVTFLGKVICEGTDCDMFVNKKGSSVSPKKYKVLSCTP